jgi:hypothetical protein
VKEVNTDINLELRSLNHLSAGLGREDDFYGDGVADFIDTLNKNITVRDYDEIDACLLF